MWFEDSAKYKKLKFVRMRFTQLCQLDMLLRVSRWLNLIYVTLHHFYGVSCLLKLIYHSCFCAVSNLALMTTSVKLKLNALIRFSTEHPSAKAVDEPARQPTLCVLSPPVPESNCFNKLLEKDEEMNVISRVSTKKRCDFVGFDKWKFNL